MTDDELDSMIKEIRITYFEWIHRHLPGKKNFEYWKMIFCSLTDLVLDLMVFNEVPMEEKEVTGIIKTIQDMALQTIKNSDLKNKSKELREENEKQKKDQAETCH